jgi:hypothetical protein
MSAMSEGRKRPHLLAGIGLPLRAVVEMARHREERGPLVLVISLLLGGTLFYSLWEGWSLVDALYFSAMSLATVGFGDLVPETDVGKVFTVVYVLGGIGTLVAFFTALTAKVLAMEAERQRARGVLPPG